MLSRLIKRILFGPVVYGYHTVVGGYDPQAEVSVSLHGLIAPLDVTHCHLLACGAPLTIGVELKPEDAHAAATRAMELRFHRSADRHALGEIYLRYHATLPIGEDGMQLVLFHITGYKNRTVSAPRLWAYHQLFKRSYRPDQNPDVPITLREAQAMIVFYLCARPVNVVTVVDETASNCFPMNLMGRLGNGYFAFSLNSHRATAPLVDRARHAVISSIPLEQASAVASLGRNHRCDSIGFAQLPFPMMQLDGIDTPVPAFASAVRDLQVESAHPLGSHTLFLAKIVTERKLADGPQYFNQQGLYLAVPPSQE